MKQVHNRLYVGDDTDCLRTLDAMKMGDPWFIVHAAKEPYHRQFVGYGGRGAPIADPEYLYAQRGTRLALNLIDTDDVSYIPVQLIDKAVSFVRSAHWGSGRNTLIHCNKGRSRSPTIAMLYMAPELHRDYDMAVEEFRASYPDYNPMKGFIDYARLSWRMYHEYVKS